MSNPFDVLAFVAVAGVFVILCFGIYSLFKGGDYARSRSNKLMRLRVLVQFIAILLLCAGFYWKSRT
ncbi:MAG: twin transmembrane helix small protein [Caulobacterales bacterium]